MSEILSDEEFDHKLRSWNYGGVDEYYEQIVASHRALQAKLADAQSAIEVIQSSRDILLNTFCQWQVEYQDGKMAKRQVPELQAKLAASETSNGNAVALLSARNHELTESKQRITDLEAHLREMTKERDRNYNGLSYLMGAIVDAGGSVSQPYDVVHHANEIRKLGAKITTLRGLIERSNRQPKEA